MRILVTGGAGFIGSAVVQRLLAGPADAVLNLDLLTYASNPQAVDLADPRYAFLQADIADPVAVAAAFADFRPTAVLHLAAESHVDRSIDGPGEFIRTNVTGTFTLLQAALAYWRGLAPDAAAAFRFVHVSTDEVYGDLEADAPPFHEATPYQPSSPYSASKAASDHLARAWFRTYGLPTIVTNCSNNYGPRQFPEKLIPLMILNALAGRPLPVYGDGQQVRDWLHVADHADALATVLERGVPGETYNIGGRSERRNLEVVHALCDTLGEARPRADGGSYRDLITRVADRPGHDRRYAIDDRKIAAELGWQPAHDFTAGLRDTVGWYLDNIDWCDSVRADSWTARRGQAAATANAA